MKRRVIIIAVIVVGVAALLFGADRGLQVVVERRVATEVQTAVAAPQAPAVNLGAFPFVTEIATGRINAAEVQLSEFTIPDSDGAVVTDVDATLSEITVTDGFRRVVASQAEATGLISYESLSKLARLPVAYDSPGKVAIQFSLPLGRETFTGSATGRPVLDADRQSLAFEDITVTVPGSEGDQAVLDAAGRLVLRSVPLGELPYDLQVTELEVTDAGIRVGASGVQVPLRG